MNYKTTVSLTGCSLLDMIYNGVSFETKEFRVILKTGR